MTGNEQSATIREVNSNCRACGLLELSFVETVAPGIELGILRALLKLILKTLLKANSAGDQKKNGQ
jgi:hypothetical protein